MSWWAKYISEVRFRDGGREWPRLDCFGLVCAVYQRELGIVIEQWPKLRLDTIHGDEISLLDEHFTRPFEPVQMGFERPFDVAVIRRPIAVKGRMKRGWWHTGVITRPGHVLHLEEMAGVTEASFRDTPIARGAPYLKPVDVRLYRHINFAAPTALVAVEAA